MSNKPVSPPAPTGQRVDNVSILGKHLALGMDDDEGMPVLIGMHGTDDLFLPLFTDEDEMRATLESLDISFRSSVSITDPEAFLSGVPRFAPLEDGKYVLLRIILDPVPTSQGARFLEIQRFDGAAEA